MRKKLFAVLLMTTMIISLFGCGKSGKGETSKESTSDVKRSQEEEITEDEAPLILKIIFPYVNAAPSDTETIEAALSEIALKEINAKVKLEPIAYASWVEQFNLVMSDSSESVDLIFTGMTNQPLSTMVNKNYLIELDELLEEYGSELKAELGDYIVGGKVAGVTYAVPTLRDLATSAGVMFLKSYIDKYQIDVERIENWEDLTEVLKTIKEGEGENFAPMFLNGSQYSSLTATFSDQLGDSLGTLLAFDESGTVVNQYATDEYRERVELIHSWYEAGYINKDAATTSALWQEAVQAGTVACWPNNMKPGQVKNQMNMCGQELVGVHIGTDIVTTYSLQTAMWSIPYQAQYPAKSMQLLNLMYTNADFFNTLNWGIEGTHYVKTEDGHITFPDGVDANSSGWYLNLGWVFGNQFLSYLWEGNDLDLWEQTKAFNDNAELSMAAGFVFDSSNVKNEYAACQAVKKEYVRALETGSVGLDKLDEMNQKYEASGIQAVIREKQIQLDAFLKSE